MRGNDDVYYFSLICDDNYAMPTAVTIESIKESMAGCYKEIYVLSFLLNKQNEDMLRNLSDEYSNVTVIHVDASTYDEIIKIINVKSHVSVAALLKFDLAKLLPDNVDRVLYVDSDIVVKDNLNELFEVELEDNVMAASFEFWKYWNEINKNGNDICPDFYFNSGVILFDLNKFKDGIISDLLWKTKIEFSNNINQKSILMDQDVFNCVCGNMCKPLPIRYNLNPRFIDNNFVKVEWINKLYGTDYKDLDEIYTDACIVHYVGKEDKPWNYYSARKRKLWDGYYTRAGFDLDSLERINIKKDMKYYLSRIMFHINEEGFIGVLKYIKNRVIK